MIIVDTKEMNKKIELQIEPEGLKLSILDKKFKISPTVHLNSENVKNLLYWLNRYQERATIESEFKAK